MSAPSATESGSGPELSPDDWVRQQREQDRAAGVWPQALPRLLRARPGASPLSLVFLHGWGGCRAEGEAVLDPLAEALGLNLLYLRLPGHGLSADAQAEARPEDYLRVTEEGLRLGEQLGERVVLIGSSTGGLLCAGQAAQTPRRVGGLILLSPFFQYRQPLLGALLGHPLGIRALERWLGPDRDASFQDPATSPALPGYEEHWLTRQRTAALLQLETLRRAITRAPGFPEQTVSPCLLLHYYRSRAHRDEVVSTRAMRRYFDRLGGAHSHPLSRRVAIADGNHVLTSAYVRSDHAQVSQVMRAFLEDLLRHA